jgi:hypothetical protein
MFRLSYFNKKIIGFGIESDVGELLYRGSGGNDKLSTE